MQPLVSVLMPCYNSAPTLPMALASLKAQTYENWECVFVDDGSVDSPQQVVAAANDGRIRYIRLGRNMGRGVARQVTLDQARGDLVTMVDADDWIYPSKLSKQVALLTSTPELAVVSTAMAIVDCKGQLAGVRGVQSRTPMHCRDMRSLGMPPLAFAPSMMRTDTARRAGFDSRFCLAQDVDFLLRVILGRRFAVIAEALYVYSEHASATVQKVTLALSYTAKMFWKYRARYPVAASMNISKVFGKAFVYRCAARAGLWERILVRRSRRPSQPELEEFEGAFKQVSEIARGISAECGCCTS